MKFKGVYKFETVSDLESIERVSENVSNRYVPIYSSEICKIMETEGFKFIGGKHFGKGSKHYFDLKHHEGVVIRFYNSYDRSFALRAYLKNDFIQLPLFDNYRIVHMGERAKNLVQHLEEIKHQITKTIPNMQKLIKHLNSVTPDKETTDKIKEIVFKYKYKNLKKAYDNEKFEYINYVDTIIEKMPKNKKMSLYTYINLTVKNFIDGNYGVKYPDGSIKSGRYTRSTTSKIIVLNKISKMLQDRYPEYFI